MAVAVDYWLLIMISEEWGLDPLHTHTSGGRLKENTIEKYFPIGGEFPPL